jgi:hypothetical protein
MEPVSEDKQPEFEDEAITYLRTLDEIDRDVEPGDFTTQLIVDIIRADRDHAH